MPSIAAEGFWWVAQLRPARERLATRCLNRLGYHLYLPRIRQRRTVRGRVVDEAPALFPGYLFIAIAPRWHDAYWAPGVRQLLLDGDRPARVPNQVIAELRARERNGLVALPRRGDLMRVTAGPLRDCFGLYDGQRGSDRVVILLALLGSQQRTTLPATDVALAARLRSRGGGM